ncbi:quinone oxidoreductase-like protein 2 homolog [Acanthaster planci]|uniref:Quinone oxidoreductase-like protein 2 homolog n=1 Tax=Acanthaster planci TaxID=133434 RepID=A0A8B7Z4Z0_ACAPL|nr:quinone oxidoreductase-like protein 2 homolog [Acanthaster planci]
MLQRGFVVAMAAFRCPPEVLLRSAARGNLTSCKAPLLTSSAIGPHSVASVRHTHRAAVCNELGKPLTISQVPSPDSLSDGQVRVAIHTCGVNFADILTVAGQYQVKPPLPFTPGNEVAGEVLDIGEGVSSFKKGDRVIGLLAVGAGFSEECVAYENELFQIPDSMGYEEAASLPVSYGTAWMGLTRRANTQPGETVLVTAAAGGVGLASVELASKVLGAKVIGAAGGPEKCKLVSDKGAFATIDYKQENLREKTKELTQGKGANVIMDAVGGDVWKECLRCISWEGRLVVIGFASGDIPKIPANLLLVKNISAMGLFWGNYRMHDPPRSRQSVEDCIRFFKEGKIRPHVCKTFPLEKINEAFQYVMMRKSTGKVVVTMRN